MDAVTAVYESVPWIRSSISSAGQATAGSELSPGVSCNPSSAVPTGACERYRAVSSATPVTRATAPFDTNAQRAPTCWPNHRP